MPILSKPSSAAYAALMYITVGALLLVWSGVWWWSLSHNPEARDITFYWCYGFMLTGLVLLVIGFGVGQIGRAARHAELPPQEVTAAATRAEQLAAERAPIVQPVNPAVAPLMSAPPLAPAAGQVVAAVPVAPAAQQALNQARR